MAPDARSGRRRLDAAAPPFSYWRPSDWLGWHWALEARSGVVAMGDSRGGWSKWSLQWLGGRLVAANSSWRRAACNGEWSLIVSLTPSFIPVNMGEGRPPRRRRKGPSDAWRVVLLGVV
jgi:hypothetical protein